MGPTKAQTLKILLLETRVSILAAIIAGFGRVIAEVGAAKWLAETCGEKQGF